MALKRTLQQGIEYGMVHTSPDIKGIRGLPSFTTVVRPVPLPNGDISWVSVKAFPVRVRTVRNPTPAQVDNVVRQLLEIPMHVVSETESDSDSD